MSHATWSVCLSVCWSHWSSVQNWMNRSICRRKRWFVWSRGTMLDEGRDPLAGMGNFGGCSAHWRTMRVCVCIAVYAAKGIMQSSITGATAAADSTRVVGITLHVGQCITRHWGRDLGSWPSNSPQKEIWIIFWNGAFW